MNRTSHSMIIGGAVATIAGVFLPYRYSDSLWQLTKRYPIILIALALVAAALAIVSLRLNRMPPLLFAAIASAALLGEAFPANLVSYRFKSGFILLAGGSAVMTIGGLLAVFQWAQSLRRNEVGSPALPGALSTPSISRVPAAYPPAAIFAPEVKAARVPAAASASTSGPVPITTPGPPGVADMAPSHNGGPPSAQESGAEPAASQRGSEGPPQPNRTAASVLPRPGWYPDPSGQARERFWSGEAWTPELRD